MSNLMGEDIGLVFHVGFGERQGVDVESASVGRGEVW